MEIPTAHPVTNPATGECSNSACPCHELAQSDTKGQGFTKSEKAALADLAQAATTTFNPCDHGFPLGVMCAVCRVEDEEFIATLASAATAATVKAAIADVLDAGWCETASLKYHWHFDPNDESEEETEARGRFIDLVVNRIAQLQRPPHNMDARDLWHDGYREGLAEGLRRANEDLRQLVEKERR